MKKRTYRLLCVFASTVLLVTGALTGCSSSGKSGVSKGDGTQQTEEENGAERERKTPKIDGLKYQKAMQLKYATGFDVYYYKGGYKLLDVHDDRQYLIVPEGEEETGKWRGYEIVNAVLKQPAGSHLSCGNIGNGTVRFDGWPGQYPDVRRTGFRLVY